MMTAVLTLLTAVAADLSIWALIAVRAAEGFFEVCRGTCSGADLIKNDFSLSLSQISGSYISCHACHLGEVGTTC